MGALENLESRVTKLEGILRVFNDPDCKRCTGSEYKRGKVFDGDRFVLCDCVQGELLKLKGAGDDV